MGHSQGRQGDGEVSSGSPKEQLGGGLVAGTPWRKNGTEMAVGRKLTMKCPVATAFKLSMLND